MVVCHPGYGVALLTDTSGTEKKGGSIQDRIKELTNQARILYCFSNFDCYLASGVTRAYRASPQDFVKPLPPTILQCFGYYCVLNTHAIIKTLGLRTSREVGFVCNTVLWVLQLCEIKSSTQICNSFSCRRFIE